MTNKNKWELHNKIEKILDRNIKEIPYEGTEVNKAGIIEEVLELITNNVQTTTDKKLLKVWEFRYEVEYGNGMALVAAIDLETAIKYMNEYSTGFGRWVIEYTEPISHLTYESSDNVHFITSMTYAQ